MECRRSVGFNPITLIFYQLPDHMPGHHSAIRFAWDRLADVNAAFPVDRDALSEREVVERVLDRPVLRAADKHTLLVVVVDNIQRIVGRDENAARRSKLRPLIDEVAVLVENLNSMVAAIANQQPPPGVEEDRMRHVELAGAAALLPPCFDEFAVLREFHDA